MKIIGPDEIVFGVENIEDCRTYLRDYGLAEVVLINSAFRFEALDGTAITLHPHNDPALPAPLGTGTTFRQTIWGCEDQEAVIAVADELSGDRDLLWHDDGSISTIDDLGFPIAFRKTTRREVVLEAEAINSPGAPPGRAPNDLGTERTSTALPRTLSHIVYFTPDQAKMERFYVDRLGFRVIDRFTNAGPFLQPPSNDDHHSMFMIQAPPHMQGLEHFAYHVQGPTEVLLAGSRMVAKGYQSFWGPGRHKFGSNWFWYFNSPLGVHVEYDADMDKHDETWVPRVMETSADASQLFLFQNVPPWFPGDGPPNH